MMFVVLSFALLAVATAFAPASLRSSPMIRFLYYLQYFICT